MWNSVLQNLSSFQRTVPLFFFLKRKSMMQRPGYLFLHHIGQKGLDRDALFG